jgi:hypothetical protein
MSDQAQYSPGPDDNRRCSAHTSAGKPCGRWAIKGGTVCIMHGGRAPQVKAAAKERTERAVAEKAVATYGLAVDVDPLDALLGELRRTAGHVAWLGTLIAQLQHEHADLKHSGLKQYSAETGTTRPSVWVEIYQSERAHLARVAKDCVAANIDERRVKLAEDQGRLVADVIRRIVTALGLDPASDDVREIVRRELTLVSGDPGLN